MSKPRIANSILLSEDDNDKEESIDSETSLQRLKNYTKTISIDKYPAIIQQAIKDIRYISGTQRDAQKDELVRIEVDLFN